MTTVGLDSDPSAARAETGVRRGLVLPSAARAVEVPFVLAIVGAAVVAWLEAVGPLGWATALTVAVVVGLELAASPRHELAHSWRPVRRLLITTGALLLAASALAWATPGEVRAAGGVVLASAAVLAIGLVLRARTAGPRPVLLVGDPSETAELVARWATSRDVEVRGVCLPGDDVASSARALLVDHVVVAPGSMMSPRELRRLGWALERSRVELSVVSELDGVVARRVAPRVLGQTMTLSVRSGRRPVVARWAKGVVDRVIAAFALVVLAPVLLTVGVLVRRDSTGPAVFRQTRVGLDGRLFRVWKFRTMHVDAELRLSELRPLDEGAGPLFKLADDPRTTRFGRVLRKTSIDELPQLVNVLRGEMSLVGPRPCLPSEAATYDDWVARRLCVKPGITGAWQVGGRSRLSWAESVRLDLDYVDNATLRDDAWIAVRTVRAVTSADGAM